MNDQRQGERRNNDRRVRQLTSAEGWDGIERRQGGDRRELDRRKHVKHMGGASGKKDIDYERRQKERRIANRRKEGNKKKGKEGL